MLKRIVNEMKAKFSALFPISEGRLILGSPVKTANCNDRGIEKVIKGASPIYIEALKSANLPLTISCEEVEVKPLPKTTRSELKALKIALRPLMICFLH